MARKEIIAMGKIVNGIPLSVVNPDYFKRTVGWDLPPKKIASQNLSTESFSCVIQYEKYHENNTTEAMVKAATMSAVTDPYLRAVIALFFTDTQMTMKIIQATENRLDRQEVVGALICAYQSLLRSPTQEMAPFQEANATHMIEGVNFAETLLKQLEYTQNPEVIILNIHHDYLRIHHSLSDFSPLLQTIRFLNREKK